MKKLLILLCVPLFTVGQSNVVETLRNVFFGVKLETEYRISSIKHGGLNLNTNEYYDNPNIFSGGIIMGINLGKFTIGSECLINKGQYKTYNNQYMNAYDGDLVPVINPITGLQDIDPISGDLVFEKDGEHDAYTLNNSTEIKNDWQINTYVSYSIIDDLYLSVIPYCRKFSTKSRMQEWVQVPVTNITATGGASIEYEGMIMTSSAQAEWNEYGVSLGLSYTFSRFMIDLRTPIFINTSKVDAQITSQETIYLNDFTPPKKQTIILSIAYRFFLNP